MKQAKLLNTNERKRLTAIINNKRYPTRNHTIVALSFYAGLRACEIAALKVKRVEDAKKIEEADKKSQKPSRSPQRTDQTTGR